MAARSTLLKLAARTCNHAIDHYEAGTPYDRSFFNVGIAAHAICQRVGENAVRGSDLSIERIADATVEDITQVGRSFDGDPEPPMPIDAAIKGRDLALQYLASNQPSNTAVYEAGYAVDSNWKPCKYGKSAHYVAALDVLDIFADTDEDGNESTVVIVTDYKSAWPTDETELDTVQMKGQAVLAAIHHPEATIIRRCAVNMRTGATYSADVVMDDDGIATIERWRKDLELAILAVNARGQGGKRVASPGASCFGCPYILRCDAAKPFWSGDIVAADPKQLVSAFAVIDALRSALFPLAKAATANEAIPVDGGIVGFLAKPTNKVRDEAARILLHRWFDVTDPATWDADNGRLIGFVAALKLSVKNVASVATVLHPGRGARKAEGWKEAREAFMQSAIVKRMTSKFAVWKAGAVEDGESEEE